MASVSLPARVTAFYWETAKCFHVSLSELLCKNPGGRFQGRKECWVRSGESVLPLQETRQSTACRGLYFRGRDQVRFAAAVKRSGPAPDAPPVTQRSRLFEREKAVGG